MTPAVTRRGLLAPAAEGAAGVRRTIGYLLDVERVSEGYYAQGLRELALPAELRALVEELLLHERRHVEALEDALRRAGGRVPDPFRQRVPATTVERFVRDAILLEETAAGAYVEAAPRLRRTGLLDTVASIVAVEGRHLAALRHEAGVEPLAPAATAAPSSRRETRDLFARLTVPRADEQPD